MRISIRRCLSMLRNTRYGNDLAMPATNAYQGSIVPIVGAVSIAGPYRLVCRGPRFDAALANMAGAVVYAVRHMVSFPMAPRRLTMPAA